jgi:hypothetical protein
MTKDVKLRIPQVAGCCTKFYDDTNLSKNGSEGEALNKMGLGLKNY